MPASPKMIDYPIQLAYRHRVLFTEGVFDLENETLWEVLQSDVEARRQRRRALVIVDEGVAIAEPGIIGHIAAWFAHRIEALDLRQPPFVIPGGEPCKNEWALVEALWNEINSSGLDRHSYVIAVGGGAVLDAVGFAASTAHRGIRLIRLPTTTLSQGDGGVGVKNGVNYFAKKNWVGAFAVPFAVINDVRFLASLPDDQKRGGYIEAIKVASIRDREFFLSMEEDAAAMAAFDPAVLRRVIERSAALHVRHIATGGDPFELGSARPLDFGHWIAHKLEQITQFAVGHGQAVAIGICCDLIYARRMGLLPEETCQRILTLIRGVGFRRWHDALLLTEEDGTPAVLKGLEEFREHLGGDLCITLVTDLGQAVEVHEMDAAVVAESIQELKALAVAD